jgi:hypothetical protein
MPDVHVKAPLYASSSLRNASAFESVTAETIHLLSLSIQDEMGETWLLARSGMFSNECVEDDGYQGKNQEKVNQKTGDVKHDVA